MAFEFHFIPLYNFFLINPIEIGSFAKKKKYNNYM